MLSRAAGNFYHFTAIIDRNFYGGPLTLLSSALIHLSPAPSTLTLLINPNPAHNPNQLQRDGHWHTSERRPRARHGARKDAWQDQERSRARGAREGVVHGAWRVAGSGGIVLSGA